MNGLQLQDQYVYMHEIHMVIQLIDNNIYRGGLVT